MIEPKLQIFNLGEAGVSEGNVFYALFKGIDIPEGTKVYYKLSGNGLTGDDVEGERLVVDIIPMRSGPANPSGTTIQRRTWSNYQDSISEDQLQRVMNPLKYHFSPMRSLRLLMSIMLTVKLSQIPQRLLLVSSRK